MKLQHLNIHSNNTGKIAKLICCIIFAIGLLPLTSAAQQQPYSYTQYMNNLTPINPAYSLLDNVGSISAVTRKQWVGIDGAPTTFLFNGNLPIQSINGAAGLMISNDQFAVEHQTEINAYFAKAVQLGQNSFLSVSIDGGIRNYVANYSSLDSSDPNFRNDVRETKPNIGFGVMYYTSGFFVGLSVPELTIRSLGDASAQNQSNFRNHYYFTTAFIANLAEDIDLKPAALVTYANSVPTTADISATMYLKKTFGIGVNYSTTHEMAGILSINMKDFRLGYSYQFGTSSNINVGGFTNATQELTFTYRIGKNLGEHKLF